MTSYACVRVILLCERGLGRPLPAGGGEDLEAAGNLLLNI